MCGPRARGGIVRQLECQRSTARANRSPRDPSGSHNSIIYAVDDDARVCEASGELFTPLDLPSVTFGSVRGDVISSASLMCVGAELEEG
jgi:hypothetical protein